MKITNNVKEFIEKHVVLLRDKNYEEFYAFAREELDAYEIMELMLVMTQSGIFNDIADVDD